MLITVKRPSFLHCLYLLSMHVTLGGGNVHWQHGQVAVASSCAFPPVCFAHFILCYHIIWYFIETFSLLHPLASTHEWSYSRFLMSTTSHIAFQRKNSFTVSYSVYDKRSTYVRVILVSSNLFHAHFVYRRPYFQSCVQFQPSDTCI